MTNKPEIYRGDIWTVENTQGNEQEVFILGVQKKYCSTIMLKDTEPDENSVRVVSRKVMYADGGKLGYIFYDRFRDFVRTVTDEEMQEIENAVMGALGIEYCCAIPYNSDTNVSEQTAEADETEKAEGQEMVATLPEISETSTVEPKIEDSGSKKKELGHELQVVKLTAERDMLQTLYDDAISRLMTM